MRTSRGLQITSVIVAFPVLLILSSLVLILALAIQTQLKTWAIQHQPTLLTSRPISRLASTALILSPKPITRRLRLKRFLPSTVWSWLGVLTVFAFITVQKLDLVSCSQKAYALITTEPAAMDDSDCSSSSPEAVSSSIHNTSPAADAPEEDAVESLPPALKTSRRKKVRTKHRSSNTGAAQKIALQPLNTTPPSTPKQEQRRRRRQQQQQQQQQQHQQQQQLEQEQQQQQPPLLDDSNPTINIAASVPEDTTGCCGNISSGSGSGSGSGSSSSEEEDMSEWISVDEKRKKKTKHDYPAYYHPQEQQDDELPKEPVMHNVVQEEEHQPVIRNWYSPFSTGLDLDIMQPRNKQDDQHNWRMDPFYQHVPFFQEQPFSFFDHTTMSV